ncbi:MAG: heavy metal-responsive transcriptional regulator [SAR324 cluster bacterium]|nr:heavy metal-responsive transcriptional regulator [SAR324 cluster bacterium]MCH8887851.1 heavy metal-responsive transcriptional regulator [SAR324 cluster bacterium]
MPSRAMYIGEAASKAETTIKTLRYYERIGLIPPAPRSNGRFRVYHEDTVERVRFIRKAQALGFSLEEIRGIVRVHDQGECSCGQVAHTVETKLKILDRKVKALNRLKEELLEIQQRLPRAGSFRSSRICPVIHSP